VQAGKPADAIPWFERALAGTPTFAEARLNLGIAHQQSGNVDKAIEIYRRVEKETPPETREHRAAVDLLRQLDRR